MTSKLKKLILVLVLLVGSEAYAKKAESEWYVTLMVHSEDGLKDKHNVLGQMKESSDGFDRHDLVELRPFASPYLALNFFHPEWDKADAHFASDYHDLKYSNQDKWTFQVESDDLQRKMTLSWKQLTLINPKKTAKASQKMVEKLMNEMWLIDLKTQKVIKAYEEDTAQNYQFSMEEEEVRSFMWILGKEPSVQDIEMYEQSEKKRDSLQHPPSNKPVPKKSQNLLELQPPGHSKYPMTSK